eukprot:TRINITY_DN1840_c0_g2_i1.p1 TRINITY_DN1840_c0_g2~~TRINITY_DN1840_c0_g2_i1.p1  ORF type:complete len:225 (-),score=81.30 TRINITY_DN1840_c0_g2_i1:66-710(-)
MSAAAFKFRNGAWEGTFTLGGKKKELIMDLKFSGDGFNGKGQELAMGDFTVTGTVSDQPPFACDAELKFATGDDLKFSGWREKDTAGMFGSWTGSLGQGNFAIHPVTDIAKANGLLSQLGSSHEQNLNELVAMGYPKEQCMQALQESDTLQDAVDWLTTQAAAPKEFEEVTPTPGKVQQLVEMGFDKGSAETALKLNDDNLDMAMELLLAQQQF